jgi:hypothetical protein
MKFITDEIISKSGKIPLLNPKQFITSTFEYVSILKKYIYVRYAESNPA